MIVVAGKQETYLRALPSFLFWLGVTLAVVGFVIDGMWNDVPWAGVAVLGELALAAAVLGWVLNRMTGWSLATATACVWLLALIYFAGLASFDAVIFLALASIALGGALVPSEWSGAVSALVGFAVLSGVVGWLLPFPVHGRVGYIIGLLVLTALQWRAVVEVLRSALRSWRAAVELAPAGTWLMVMAAGIVSTCAWLPTIHYDDLSYHLGLPSQLVSLGYYKMDAASQVWAVNAWAADVLQAVTWMVAGHESRGMLDVFWLLLGLVLVWRLCEALDLPPWLRCIAVALYASLPLTAGALTGMQTEGPSAAVAAGIALLIQRSSKPDRRQLLVFASLFGLLLALKISNLTIAGPLGLWLLYRWRWHLPWRALPLSISLLLLVAGSSYIYAWVLTGNPVLPLFGGIFHSPYNVPTDGGSWFHLRWNIVWNLVFHTSRYAPDSGDGSAGFVLVALGGSVLAALFRRRTRAFVLAAIGSFLLPLIAAPYLRYTHQAFALLPGDVVRRAGRCPRGPMGTLGGWRARSVGVDQPGVCPGE
ncbi:MAG TPA: hypothetical protein VFW60_03730 [Rhodanobacteraceae bacterium]|nr:hypothetical protein [Rhodanobacteraceae bacterium]